MLSEIDNELDNIKKQVKMFYFIQRDQLTYNNQMITLEKFKCDLEEKQFGFLEKTECEMSLKEIVKSRKF